MFFKKVIHKFIHMWDDYDKVSDVFEEPVIHFICRRWTKYGGLPVWRRGIIIKIGKEGQYKDAEGGPWYGNWAKHQVWDENFLKSCTKFGKWCRSFIKPMYQLPIWLSFYYSNRPAIMKSKYDSWRFEYPPQFCIVLFGICFCWWLTAPEASTDDLSEDLKTRWSNDDAYWETILEYTTHKDDYKIDRLSGVIDSYVGYYRRVVFSEEDRIKKKDERVEGQQYSFVCCRPEYIKKEYISEYKKGVKNLKECNPTEYFPYD